MNWRDKPLLTWLEAEAVAPCSRHQLRRYARAGKLATRRLDALPGRTRSREYVVTQSLIALLEGGTTATTARAPSRRVRQGLRWLAAVSR